MAGENKSDAKDTTARAKFSQDSESIDNSRKTELSSATAKIATAKSSKEYVFVVARCSLAACLLSLLGGMDFGFSSPALQQLTNQNFTITATIPAQDLGNGSFLPSIFGVRRFS